MSSAFSVGIDLGTSNSCVSLMELTGQEAVARTLPILQLASLEKVDRAALLPSELYWLLPPEREAAGPRQFAAISREFVAGRFARERGALLPDRLVSSAKSWLCNGHVDRKAPILPWESEIVTDKVSPLQASTLYLKQLKGALRDARPELAFEDCQFVVGVPASFDEAARNLTYAAAREAGLGEVSLLEEPLAAFYSWIDASGDGWRSQIAPGDLVLVCDLGGGTADLTLIQVSQEDGDLRLDRISVGDHILLGGDNMDLALAHAKKRELEQGGKRLDRWMFLSLVYAARKAKEEIWETQSGECVFSIAGRGSNLFDSALSVSFSREQIESIILDGFFPFVQPDDLPFDGGAVGLQEIGLPYSAEPAVSKHLALFLRRSFEDAEFGSPTGKAPESSASRNGSGLLAPNKILFNGGVFKAAPIRERVKEQLRRWFGQDLVELRGEDLDLAVARGASVFGAIKAGGKGLRIRASTARSYYLGVQAARPAVPGLKLPLTGICIVPKGMEEGAASLLEHREFALVTGEKVLFRFFSSNHRPADVIGTVVEDAEGELLESAGLELLLPLGDKKEVVPVRLRSVLNDLGVLEIWMEHTRSKLRWKLEFNVRGQEGTGRR